MVLKPGQPMQLSSRCELEVWWQAHPARWPLVPDEHYIGPDGRVLPPAAFAVYAQDASKLICIVVPEPSDQSSRPYCTVPAGSIKQPFKGAP